MQRPLSPLDARSPAPRARLARPGSLALSLLSERGARLALVVLLALAAVAASPRALAQPAPAPPSPRARPRGPAAPAPAAPSPAPEDPSRVEAREHFEKGVALYRKQSWDPALAEFLRSAQLFRTRNALSNAAICLRNLRRNDEALDLYEALLREFPDMPRDLKLEAMREIKDLRGLVGTIDVQGAEPEASIAIDGLTRGDFPALAPLRVRSGTHTVRVYKAGFQPFEARVEVAGGESVAVAAHLRALAVSGRLHVAESSGKALTVVVDGSAVGVTPWECLLPPGEHTIALRGDGDLGTSPAMARIKRDELTSLVLAAEEVSAALRVEPTPPGAIVAIDAVPLGHGIWQGRLRAGEHEIHVAAEGFLPESRRVSLERSSTDVVTVALRRDLSSPLWRRPPRFTIELTAAGLIAPSFAGDVALRCASPCSRGVGAGMSAALHAGYELGSGFGFGITAGYLWARQSTENRPTVLTPTGLPDDSATISDRLTLRGVLLGAFAGLAFGERFPLRARIGGGAVIGSVGDLRTGSFTARNASRYDIGPVGISPAATSIYVAPEIRLGARIGAHLELAASVEALVLVSLNRPTWDPGLAINAATDGSGSFAAERLTGAIVVMAAPGLVARYDF